MTKTKSASFDKIVKSLDNLENILSKGIDFGEVTANSTEYHEELLKVTNRLDSIKNNLITQEKDAIDEAMRDALAPLIAKANGNIDVLREIVQNVVTTESTQKNTPNTQLKSENVPAENGLFEQPFNPDFDRQLREEALEEQTLF